MDFLNAGLFIAAVYAVMKVVNKAGLDKLKDPVRGIVTPLVAAVVGVGAAFLVADTVWAHEQVIGGAAMDALNDSSLIVAGLLAGLGSVVVDTTLKTVRNVGENDPTT